MNESATDVALKLRPVLVYRSKVAGPTRREVCQNPSVLRQYDSIKQFAAESAATMAPFSIIVRTPARFRPQHDRVLLEIIERASAERELLLLDDVFRLVDCRDYEGALKDIHALTATVKAPLFSVLHRQPLWKMQGPFIRAQIGERVRAFQRRSSSAKAGIERIHVPDRGPGKSASVSGARMKKKIADERATRLLPTIEATRSSLPLELQSSLSAIANALNQADVPTPSGRGRWQGIMVKRVLDRVGSLAVN